MKKYFLFLTIFVFLFIAVKAKHNRVDAELLTSVKSIQPGHDFWVGLKLKAQPEWHTYWRNPGDSGLPTAIEWELPDGFQHGDIQWPAPHVFSVEGIANYGFGDEVILPVKIIVPDDLDAGKKITLKAKASWLACRVECVPESEDLSVILPVRNEPAELDDNIKNEIENTISNLPKVNTDYSVSAALNENIVTIFADGKFDNPENIRFFPYEAGFYNNSAVQKLIQKENRFSLHIPLDDFKIGIPQKVYGILYFEYRDAEKNNSIEINVNLKK